MLGPGEPWNSYIPCFVQWDFWRNYVTWETADKPTCAPITSSAAMMIQQSYQSRKNPKFHRDLNLWGGGMSTLSAVSHVSRLSIHTSAQVPVAMLLPVFVECVPSSQCLKVSQFARLEMKLETKYRPWCGMLLALMWWAGDLNKRIVFIIVVSKIINTGVYPLTAQRRRVDSLT